MRIKAKKVFTLVELLVVIAIIAILAVVGIVSYLAFTRKANFSNDVGLIAQLNTVLTAEESASGKNATFQEARDDLLEQGIDITKVKVYSKDHRLAWDCQQDRIVLLDGDSVTVAPDDYKEGKKADIDALTVNHRYNFSFEARLALANDLARDAYASIAEFASEFKAKRARSRRKERIYLSRTSFAALFFRGKKLCIALRLDPNDEAYAKYKLEDVSDQASLSGTPAMMRITCKRGRRIFGVGKFFGRAISQLRADGDRRRCAHQVSARKAHRISRRAL